MLDINWINKNQELFLKSMEKRNIDFDLNELLNLDKIRKEALLNMQNLQARKNQIAKEVGILKLKKENEKKIAELILEGENLNKQLKIIEKENENLQNKLTEILEKLPNILSNEVPFGKIEDENVLIKIYGEKPNFDFQPLEHFEIGKNFGFLDFERAAKISGSRFVIMKNKIAKLERVLRNFMTDICVNEFGYEEIFVPYLINQNAAYFAGQLPKFEEDLFQTTTGHFLIPTSETVLVNIYADEILNELQFPIRMCTYSPCFRSEAGSAGKDTSGMLRQHQFTKVEIVSIISAENSQKEHERMLSCAEMILQKLELHYRIMLLCSGDTGFCSSKTYDIEIWLPGQNKYREICSCSNTTDFQSRRAKIRFTNQNGKKEFPYMLNSSALAIGRTIIAIMENYQTKDGDFEIPDVLKKYF